MLPEGTQEYARTRTFSEGSVPDGLLKTHTTKSGTWGKIVVLEGRLLYRILEPVVEEMELNPSLVGLIEPGVRHEVELLGCVEFYVAFYCLGDVVED